jgi:hypothetical protein
MIDPRLIGRWHSEPRSREQVTMEFGSDGKLVCISHTPGKKDKIFLEFTTHAGVIVTDQPSDRRKEETNYTITDDGKLVLNYGGEVTAYIRSE